MWPEGLAAEGDGALLRRVDPLMQLSMELLPAPLGPMMERISCSFDVEGNVRQAFTRQSAG